MNRTTRLRRFILIFAFTTYACSNATADVSENFEAGHRAIGGSIQIANDFGPELKVTERSNQFTLDIVPWFLFFRPNGQAFRLSPSLGVEINQLYWGGAAIDVDVGIGLSYIKYIHRFADETGRVPYFGIGTALIFYPVYSGAIIDEFTYDRVLDAYLFIEPEVSTTNCTRRAGTFAALSVRGGDSSIVK